MNASNIAEITMDVAIMFFAGWLALLFRRAYRQSRNPGNAALALMFSVLFMLQIAELAVTDFLHLRGFEWMHTHLPADVVWAALLVIILVASHTPDQQPSKREKRKKAP